jgi:hypothetical protein
MLTKLSVDAASGGFVAPFINPDLLWDFRLPKVVSINVSGHKYGLVSLPMEGTRALLTVSRYIQVWDGAFGQLNPCRMIARPYQLTVAKA